MVRRSPAPRPASAEEVAERWGLMDEVAALRAEAVRCALKTPYCDGTTHVM